MGREQDFLTVLQTARNRGVKTPFFVTVIDNFAKSKWQLHTETGDPPLIPLNDAVMRQLDHPVDVFVAPCLYPNELAADDVVLLASIGLEDLTSDCNAMGPRFRDFLILADAHARLEALGLFATLGWTEQEDEEAA